MGIIEGEKHDNNLKIQQKTQSIHSTKFRGKKSIGKKLHQPSKKFREKQISLKVYLTENLVFFCISQQS
jgi:hypothetical protein